jgi:hypothetical protein
MKKVKSRRAPATATRQPKAATGRSRKPAKPAGRKATKPAARKAATTPRGKAAPLATKPAARKGAKAVVPAKPGLQIRELDPLRVCGDRTSVVQLFRVDEQLVGGKVAGARQVHLVFNDRHGWYCEHGRSCHAVSAVMRHARIR